MSITYERDLDRYCCDYFGRVVSEKHNKEVQYIVRARVSEKGMICLTQSFNKDPTVNAEWNWNEKGLIQRVTLRISGMDTPYESTWRYFMPEHSPDNSTTISLPRPELFSAYMGVINRSLIKTPLSKQLSNLLYIGHTSARQIDFALEKGRILKVPNLLKDQIPLSEGAHNPLLRTLLRSVGERSPHISGEQESLKLRYKSYLVEDVFLSENIK